MSDFFIWWAFYASPLARIMLFWILLFSRLCVVYTPSSPFSPHSTQYVSSGHRQQQQTPVGKSCVCVNVTRYNRSELLAVSPTATPLAPDVIARLRLLQIGVHLPRKRYPRKKKTNTVCKTDTLSLWCLNAQSCREKTTAFNELIVEKAVDIFAITETWLAERGDEARIENLKPPGYKCHTSPRLTGGRGGGIAVIMRACLWECARFKNITYPSFDAVEIRLTIKGVISYCICLYRTPPSVKNKLKDAMFLRDFPELLSVYAESTHDCCIIGDFNFHHDNPNDSNVKRLTTLFSDHNLVQLVNVPTQRRGHTLDWVVVRRQSCLLTLNDVVDCAGLSDHNALVCTLSIAKPPALVRSVTSRNIKALCMSKFKSDICLISNRALSDSSCDIDELSVNYFENLRRLLDTHAPEVTRSVRDRPSAPWISDEIRDSRRQRRRAERCWRKKGGSVKKDIFVKARNSTSAQVEKARELYHRSKIAVSKNRQLFSISHELLGKKIPTPLPNDCSKTDLPARFANFFSEKISRLRHGVENTDCAPPIFEIYNGPKLEMFSPVSEMDIEEIIKSMPTKSCSLDPIPTSLLKEYLPELIPVIARIVNCSLCEGRVPDVSKHAIVCPLLKKAGLDPNELKNYRPVSNLSFISKVLEKVVLKQLLTHLSDNGLLEIHQSAYRKGHSTESAVLSVLDGLLINADNRQVSLLALLDLSAAFDTLDHPILLKRLDVSFGLCGNVLKWFTSYISDRSQAVLVDGILSSRCDLKYGVPQGSVLGPVLFTLYAQPLSDVIIPHGCSFHKYADDTQLSKSSDPQLFSEAKSTIQLCIDDVLAWMKSNRLVLNTDKTELMPIGSAKRLMEIGSSSASIGGCEIQFATSVKYLGITFDETLSFHEQISNVCRSAFLEMRRIASIRRCLSTSTCAQLVSALIISRLDYCNAIYGGLTNEEVARLQRIQNCAARLVLRKRKYDHVTPLLKQLHWLPVLSRVQFKIATFAYRHFDGTLPAYLSHSLTTYCPPRNLRSSKENTLVPPECNLKSAGERAFYFLAPSIWNALPSYIRNQHTLEDFKARLKTHLFRQAFD